MTEITQDEIIGIVAGHDSMSIRGIQRELGTTQSGKVSSLITQMVRNETLRRVKGRIELNDPPTYENSGRSMETTIPPLPTDKGFVIRKEKRTEKAKMEKKDRSWPPPQPPQLPKQPPSPIATLEDAEQAADEDKGIRAALSRLEDKIKTDKSEVPPLPNYKVKHAMLHRFEELMEDSIAKECAELRRWIDAVYKSVPWEE